MITFYPLAIELDTEHRKRVMRHELMHIGIEPGGKLYIVPHDVEDFRAMLDEYGMDWAKD